MVREETLSQNNNVGWGREREKREGRWREGTNEVESQLLTIKVGCLQGRNKGNVGSRGIPSRAQDRNQRPA